MLEFIIEYKFLLCTIWFFAGIHNWGATLGYFGSLFPPARNHYGIAIFMAINPVGIFVIPFLSSFYKHGFRWK